MGREGCSHPQPSLPPIPQSHPQLSLPHPQPSLPQSLPRPQLPPQGLQVQQQRLPQPWLCPPLPLQQNKSSKIQIQLFISSTPFFYRLCRRVILDKKNPDCYI